ncbi:MAG: Gfo/Idh/MocA family oxidoreductase [bacterium]|nr:Gfo/Idh/MocA family oxidoreductase [bacterium]
MVRLGLIGLGGIGNCHAMAIARLKNCKIVAGADLLPKARKAFAAKYPDVAIYKDHTSLLKEADIDAALVCIETLYHKNVGIDVMRSGRPVLCEKPMARTVADAKRMLDASDKTGQLLMIAQCRRYDKDWGRFAKMVKDGTLGRPLLWRSVAGGPGPGSWYMDDKIGGGPLLDGAVHNYDFANLIFGKPESVIATEIKLTKRSAVDTASAVVQYAKGDQLMMSWSWGVAQGGGTGDVLGPKASLLFGPGDMKPEGDEGGYGYYRVSPLGKKPRLIRFKYDFLDMYTQQARHFAECVKGKAKCLSPGTEAIKGVAVAEAILKAARKGGTCKVKW